MEEEEEEERLFGVEATEGDGLVLELGCGSGLGRHSARRSGCSLSTTSLRGLLTLSDLTLGVEGEALVCVRSTMLPVVLLRRRSQRDTALLSQETDDVADLLSCCPWSLRSLNGWKFGSEDPAQPSKKQTQARNKPKQMAKKTNKPRGLEVMTCWPI